jgi:hypothetical protein
MFQQLNLDRIAPQQKKKIFSIFESIEKISVCISVNDQENDFTLALNKIKQKYEVVC